MYLSISNKCNYFPQASNEPEFKRRLNKYPADIFVKLIPQKLALTLNFQPGSGARFKNGITKVIILSLQFVRYKQKGTSIIQGAHTRSPLHRQYFKTQEDAFHREPR